MAFHTRLHVVMFMLMLVTVPAPPRPGSLPLGGYRMALFWPPGVCYVAGSDCDKDQLSDAFTAHGLWPFYTNYASVVPDGSKQFTGVGKVLAEINYPSWKSYFMSDREDIQRLWKHEWNNHGAGGLFSEEDYFETGLRLTQDYGRQVAEILANEGITPTYPVGNGYKVSHIELAIYNRLNVRPEIVCKEGPTKGLYVLYEIRLLFDTNAKNLFDAKSSVCTEQRIYFLSTESFKYGKTEL